MYHIGCRANRRAGVHDHILECDIIVYSLVYVLINENNQHLKKKKTLCGTQKSGVQAYIYNFLYMLSRGHTGVSRKGRACVLMIFWS